MVSETPDRGKADMPPSEEAELLALHGIERVPADQFLIGGYRYGNLADALAQARRIEGGGR